MGNLILKEIRGAVNATARVTKRCCLVTNTCHSCGLSYHMPYNPYDDAAISTRGSAATTMQYTKPPLRLNR